jgi:serine/threonine-protein kinase
MSEPELRDRLQHTLGTNYRVSREIGGGGMAHVFVADDESVDYRVVVKVLAPELAAGVNGERFKREIALARRLDHPRIVPVLSATSSGDVLFYTMPFIGGDTLRAMIDADAALAVRRAVLIARDIAEALAYAHAENIVHRDIKPENVLIDRATGRALVTDFGIARAVERASDVEGMTTTGLTLGTPTYMSPEQAAAERHIDGRSDVYSLGCVLFELLAGAPPFTGPSARAIIARHMTEAPPSLRTVRSDVPPRLQVLVERMLAKSPNARLSAEQVIEALDRQRAADESSTWHRIADRLFGRHQ